MIIQSLQYEAGVYMTSGEYERYLEKPNPYRIVRSKE